MASEIGVQTIQHTNGTDAMTIDSSGRVLTPARPAFTVGFSSSGNLSLNDNTLIPFDNNSSNDCYDLGSNFNTTTSRFVAPVTGTYMMLLTVFINTSGSLSCQMKVNGNVLNNGADTMAGFKNDAGTSSHLNLILQLNATDYVEAFTRNGSYNVYKNHSFWSGALLG